MASSPTRWSRALRGKAASPRAGISTKELSVAVQLIADAHKFKGEYMWKIASGWFVGLVLLAPAANAQFARQEVIAFESAMMPPEDFLADKKGTTVTLAGYLRWSVLQPEWLTRTVPWSYSRSTH